MCNSLCVYMTESLQSVSDALTKGETNRLPCNQSLFAPDYHQTSKFCCHGTLKNLLLWFLFLCETAILSISVCSPPGEIRFNSIWEEKNVKTGCCKCKRIKGNVGWAPVVFNNSLWMRKLKGMQALKLLSARQRGHSVTTIKATWQII